MRSIPKWSQVENRGLRTYTSRGHNQKSIDFAVNWCSTHTRTHTRDRTQSAIFPSYPKSICTLTRVWVRICVGVSHHKKWHSCQKAWQIYSTLNDISHCLCAARLCFFFVGQSNTMQQANERAFVPRTRVRMRQQTKYVQASEKTVTHIAQWPVREIKSDTHNGINRWSA